MLSFDRIRQIEEAVDRWNAKNHERVVKDVEYPSGTEGYWLNLSVPDEDPELLARAAKEMGIDETELEEYLRQADILVDENLLAKNNNISEEDLREAESLDRELREKLK